MPAGTDVCVVKTLPAEVTCRATGKGTFCSCIKVRMRSSPRKEEWPSFM